MKRRFFLFAAPAIVAAPSLMRVSVLPAEIDASLDAEFLAQYERELVFSLQEFNERYLRPQMMRLAKVIDEEAILSFGPYGRAA